jgi:general secretion pathway protein G
MDRKGMTLVEIMVVVAILVSLGAVLAVNVKGIWDREKEGETQLRISLVEQGLQGYAAVHRGAFPSTAEGLEAVLPYMHSREQGVPGDAWGNALVYRSPDGEAAYSLTSRGPDGQEGGGDDVVVSLR